MTGKGFMSKENYYDGQIASKLKELEKECEKLMVFRFWQYANGGPREMG